MNFKIITLNDYLGASGRYFGQCACCGRQFHSLRDRLAVTNVGRVCETCTTKPGLTYRHTCLTAPVAVTPA